MHSSIYADGRERGQEEGREQGAQLVLCHLFERRLGRELFSEEKERILSELRAGGAIRLANLVLDASSAQIEAFFSEPGK